MGAACGVEQFTGGGEDLKASSIVPGPSSTPGAALDGNGVANGVGLGEAAATAGGPGTTSTCLSSFPPPLVSKADLKADNDIKGIVAANQWDTDVFRLSADEHVLLLEELYKDLGLVDEFKIPPAVLRTFLLTMRAYYHEENKYHNFYHSVDVSCGVAWLIKNTAVQKCITRLEVLALFTSAIGHDVDHPGTTNTFQVNILSEIAIMHNNRSVLENHHLNVLLSVLRTDGADILCTLDKGDRATCVSSMVDNVLATDIMRHFDFSSMMSTKIMSGTPFVVDKIDDRKLVTQAIIKLADISNPSKKFDVAEQWAHRVLEEFWQQGDKEKEFGIPISPLCDRATTDFDMSQVNFVKFIVTPFFKQCAEIPPFQGMESVVAQLLNNAGMWQARVDKTMAVQTFQAVNQEQRQTLLQELFLGQILFMSQDLTDSGVVDMCNSFMESSSNIKMAQLGGDIQEFLEVVHMACSCETVTLYWQNVYEPGMFEIVGSVGQGMPTQGLQVNETTSDKKSCTRMILDPANAGVVWNNNVEQDPVYNIVEDGRLTKSILCIAVTDKERGGQAKYGLEHTKGFLQLRNKLDLNNKRGGASGEPEYKHVDFTDEDVSMTTFLIEQAVAKIQGKVEEKLMVDQIDSVLRHSESEANNAAATLEIIGVFMDKAKVLIGADRCSLFLVDDIKGELCTAYAANNTSANTVMTSGTKADDEEEQKLVIRLPLGQGLVGAAADSGKDILIPDCQSDPRFDKSSDARNNYVTQTCLCVPIQNSVGQILGVVQMLNKTAPDLEVVPFTEEDARKLRSIASKATVAIEKAQMFSKLQLIMDATNKINASSMDLDVLVAKTMSSARRLLNADRCTLFLLDQATNQLYSHITDEDDSERSEAKKAKKVDKRLSSIQSLSASVEGEEGIQISGKDQAAIRFDATKGLAGKAVVTKDSVNVQDVYEDPTFNKKIDEETGYRTKSVMCVPVMNSTGEVLGVAQMINKMDRSGETIAFSDQDEKLLKAFIAQVAVAITNNQLFTHVFDTLSLNLTILSSLPYVVIAFAVDGSFVECNRPLKDCLGVKVDAESLKEHYSTWIKEAPQALIDVLDKTFSEKVEVQEELKKPIKSGDYTYLSIHSSVISTHLDSVGITDKGKEKASKGKGVVVVMRCEQSDSHRRMCQTVSGEHEGNHMGKVRSAVMKNQSVLSGDEYDD